MIFPRIFWCVFRKKFEMPVIVFPFQVDKVSPIKLFDENKTLGGFNLRHFLHHQNGSAAIHSVYEKVIALWKKGTIKPVIDSTWALEDVSSLCLVG